MSISERNSSLPKLRLVAIGDSIIEGAGNSEEGGWIGRLEKELSPQLQVVNRGIGGNTTRDLLARLDVGCLALQPDLIVMGIGANDSRRRASMGNQTELSLAEFEQNLLQLITQVKNNSHAQIIFSGMVPVDYRGAIYKEDKRHYREDQFLFEAAITKVALSTQSGYLNHFDRWLDYGEQTISALLIDGVHPNAAGYAEMAKFSLPSIKSFTAAL